jgi:uncharacterized phage-like protein YoqJ
VLVKQTKGNDFYGCLAYVLGKDGARPLDRSIDASEPDTLNQEFQAFEQLRATVQRRVYHCALSLPIGETLSDHQWREMGKDFLNQMGFQGHQYILVQHTDRAHQHCHIIANRVGLDGAVASDAWDYTRAEAVARELEVAYGLQPLQASWATDRKALSHRQLEEERKAGTPCVQRQLQDAIDAVLAESQGLDDLNDRLGEQGIQTKITYGHNDQPIGISYSKFGVTMSGSNLGKRYTLDHLKQVWQSQELDDELAIAPADHSCAAAVRATMKATIDAVSQDKPTLPELIERLDEAGIQTHLRFGKLRHEKGQVKAITFSQGNVAYLGQSLGEAYHFAGLQTHLGIDYAPQRDNPWYKNWRSTVENRTPAPKPESKVVSVIFAGSPPQKRFRRELRDETISWLGEMSRKALEQAREQGADTVQFVTSAAPGVDQWGAVVALKLREEQQAGTIEAIPAIEVIALTQQNLAAQWGKEQQRQYEAIISAVDRVDEQLGKTDYLSGQAIVLGNHRSLSDRDRQLVENAQQQQTMQSQQLQKQSLDKIR